MSAGMKQMLALHAAMDARERPAVQALGEAIGYGRLMQLAEQIWEEKMPGAAHTTGACSFFMVPCPHPERDDNGHCEWCCGANRVTNHVAKLAEIREILAGGDIGGLPNNYSFLQIAQDRMDDLQRERDTVSTLTARVKELETGLATLLREEMRDDDDPILGAAREQARALLAHRGG